MRSSASTLMLMCQWLNAKTKKESDQLFAKYYQALATSLKGMIGRNLSGCSSDMVDDVFQEFAMKHVAQMATRQEHAARILSLARALAKIPPANLVFIHIVEWHKEVQQWVVQEMRAHKAISASQEVLEDEIKALNEVLHSLNETGLRCFTNLISHCRTNSPEFCAAVNLPAGETTATLTITDVRTIAKELKAMELEGKAAIDQELDLQGIPELVMCIAEILRLMPSVRMPTMTLLYQMAKNKAVDEYRGTQSDVLSLDLVTSDTDETSFLLDSPQFLAIRNPLTDEYDSFEAEARQRMAMNDYEKLLYKPVKLEESAMRNIYDKQELARANQRVSKLVAQFYRNRNVLELLLENHTEVEIAEILAISRDQVRTSKLALQKLLSEYANGSEKQSAPPWSPPVANRNYFNNSPKPGDYHD